MYDKNVEMEGKSAVINIECTREKMPMACGASSIVVSLPWKGRVLKFIYLFDYFVIVLS